MLKDWFDAAGEFNAARMVLLSSWGLWVTLLVVVLSAGVLFLAWHNTREQPGWRRRWLMVLRGLTVIVLGVLFIQPGVRLEHVTRVRNHVVFLLDDSRSMSLPGARSESRLEDVKDTLKGATGLIEGWREAHQIDFYALSDHARPISGPEDLKAKGDATRVLSGLEEIAARFRPEDLAAVVVVGDGADNGALGETKGRAPPAVDALAKRLGAPVHTIFTGPDEALPDVAITDVAYDDFAFVRNAVSIEAEIEVKGFTGLVLPVTLRRGEVVLGTRMLTAEAHRKAHRFEFEFVPDQTGKAVFTLEVGTGPDEKVTSNNRRQFVIRIIRDRIRTLQVVGRPSWDERFMRKLLKKNPNVDLISFFILRTGASIDVARRDELSLIPFPTQELFEEQLGSFDLIIFQNFTYRGYHMRQYLPLIREYVRKGGGFVMIGGDLSFASGGYANTPIADFLPVRLPSDRNDLIRGDRFAPTLTTAGQRHPITQLSPVPEENAAAWAALPKLSGTNRVTAVKPGAQVLLAHPERKAGDQAEPVAVVGEFEEGRVLAVTTDSTWNWDFLATGEGGDNRHYYKFWGNAIRWLIKDPELQPVRIEADRDRYPLGAEASLVTRVVGSDYAAAKDVEVEVLLEREVFEKGQRRRVEVKRHTGRTDEHGEFALRISPGEEGAWYATARAALPGGEAGDDEVFVVSADPVELRTTHARRDTLKALAEAGGGELRGLSEGLKGLKRNEPRVVKVNRRRDVPLWASAWWLLIGILLPSSEWYLRRRWGLL